MELIAVAENTLINPEHISAIEIRKFRGKKSLSIFVGNHVFSVTLKPDELLAQLRNSGIDAYEQFFAG